MTKTSKVPSRVYGHFDRTSSPQSLGEMCSELISQQTQSWPEYRQACASLLDVKTRIIECEGYSVRLIFNPGRSENTSASVNPEDILKRPCFLCPANLPEDQKAILHRNNFQILVNPRPIVPCHLTIAHMGHRPQAIAQNIAAFLEITADLGPGYVTLYNGPRCGASAPDHLHFQAVPSSEVRLDESINRMENSFLPHSPFSGNDVCIMRGVGLGREVISITSDQPGLIADALAFYMKNLDTGNRLPEMGNDEPMVNIAALYNAKTWNMFVFPRRAHRPSAFYRRDHKQVLVSPAIMEMVGIIVTPRKHDFESIDAHTITEIYREVSALPHST